MQNSLSTSSESQKFSLSEKKQFISCFSTFAINGAVALSVGALLPYILDTYGFAYALAGLLVSLHSIGNLVSSFLAGVLPLWLGRRKSMLVFSSMIIISFVLLVFVENYFAIALAFLMTGLGRGAVSNFNNAVISEIAPDKAWALNTLHATFAIGAFLAPIGVLLFTSNNALGWKAMCVFMAFAGVAELLIYALMPLTTDKIAKTKNANQSFAFFNSTSFWLCTGTLFFYLCAEQGVIGWMVTYFKESGLMSANYAQSMASVLWILILLGRLSVAWLSQKFKRTTLLAFMAVGFIGFFMVVLLGRTLPIITIGIAGFGFSIAGIYPTTVSLSGKTIKEFPLSWSVMLTIAGLGAILMPMIIGTVADIAGIYAGISSIVVAIVLAVIFIVVNILYSRKNLE